MVILLNGTNALILGGGSIKGAYQMGAIDAITSKGFVPDALYCTSVGSLNGGFLADRMYRNYIQIEKADPSLNKKEVYRQAWIKSTEDAMNFWLNQITSFSVLGKSLSVPSILWSIARKKYKGLLDLSKLNDLIKKEISIENINKSPLRIYVSYVDLNSAELKFGTNESPFFIEEMLASTKVPIIMDPYRVANRYAVDGGVRETVPLGRAIDDGHDNLVIISCQPEDIDVANVDKGDFKELINRTLALLTGEIVDNDIKQRLKIIDLINMLVKLDPEIGKYRHINHFYIRPDYTLDYDITKMTQKEIREMYYIGTTLGLRLYNP